MAIGQPYTDVFVVAPRFCREGELVKPKAFVILKAGRGPSEALADELKAFVNGRIAPYNYPRWIEFVAELPKTSTGKIQRYKLRSLGPDPLAGQAGATKA